MKPLWLGPGTAQAPLYLQLHLSVTSVETLLVRKNSGSLLFQTLVNLMQMEGKNQKTNQNLLAVDKKTVQAAVKSQKVFPSFTFFLLPDYLHLPNFSLRSFDGLLPFSVLRTALGC